MFKGVDNNRQQRSRLFPLLHRIFEISGEGFWRLGLGLGVLQWVLLISLRVGRVLLQDLSKMKIVVNAENNQIRKPPSLHYQSILSNHSIKIQTGIAFSKLESQVVWKDSLVLPSENQAAFPTAFHSNTRLIHILRAF